MGAILPFFLPKDRFKLHRAYTGRGEGRSVEGAQRASYSITSPAVGSTTAFTF